MDQQHTLIKGYRDLTQQEIDLMNRIKAFGPELEKLCDELFEYHVNQCQNAESEAANGKPDEYNRLMAAAPLLWLGEGRLRLQMGLMSLIRSVAQPTSF